MTQAELKSLVEKAIAENWPNLSFEPEVEVRDQEGMIGAVFIGPARNLKGLAFAVPKSMEGEIERRLPRVLSGNGCHWFFRPECLTEEELEQMVRDRVGPGWKIVVEKYFSRDHNDYVMTFRIKGKHCLFAAKTTEPDEARAGFAEVLASEQLAKWLEENRDAVPS